LVVVVAVHVLFHSASVSPHIVYDMRCHEW